MQYRRHEDYVRESGSMKLHAQDRLHLDPGRYYDPREALDCDRSPCVRRSLSPHRIDGSRHEVGLGQRINTFERRENDWHLRSTRNDNAQSRSPFYGQERKRPHFEEALPRKDHRQWSELQQIRGLHQARNFPADNESLDYQDGLQYSRHNDLRTRKEKEIMGGRWSDCSGQRMMGRKLVALEDRTAVGSYSSPLDMGPMPIYGDSGVLLPSPRSLDAHSFDNERLKFQNPAAPVKLQVADSHKIEEHYRFNSRNVAYPASSGFYSREYASSSSVPLTSKSLESYRDGQYFQISDESSRRRGDLMDTIGFNSYGKRTPVYSATDLEVGKRNFAPHRRGANSPRGEHEDYFYYKSEGTVNNSRGYPSGEIQKTTQTHDCINYDSAIGSDRGDFLRPKVANKGFLNLQDAADMHQDHRTGIAYNHYGSRKQIVLNYPDTGPTAKETEHDSEYAGTGSTHVETGRRVSQDYETSHMDSSQYYQILHARSDYGPERGSERGSERVGPQFLKERLDRSPISEYDEETYRNTERVQRMQEDVDTYKFRDHMLKRKYREENMNLPNHKISTPREYTPSEVVDVYDSEEWIYDDMSGRYASREAGFDHIKYRKFKKKYDQNDLFARQSYLDDAQKHKNGPRYMMGNRRHGPSSWIKSQNFDGRKNLQRQHKVREKTKEDDDYVHMDDDDPSDDWVTPTESEPSEDSEEFKQMVHEAFLKYSKRLNMKSGVRKRYKEQGNAGSLYCIVCGISYSKEFMDTQRLLKHAYMSHKVGLRARHLGLVKAICVLMGWNSDVPQDPITWVPEVLTEADALVQKEDLIIWPPVIVIRNISLSHSNPDNWTVVTIEALESFLRSKGLLKGRVKMYLGRPADQSVIVLKFLSTFSGLTDAERLDKFFSERGHGRVDFEVAKRNNGTSSYDGGVGMEGEQTEEKILYGYMGIAEDLNEVEFNIKKKSLIKSKKEILEL